MTRGKPGTLDLVIIGSGGFGREAADVVRAINDNADIPVWNLLGYLDDAPSPVNLDRVDRQGSKVLGTVDPTLLTNRTYFVVGINDTSIRRSIADRLEEAGWLPATLTHPSAVMGSGVRVGEGTVICGGVQISTNVQVGRHVHLNSNATIGHDAQIEDLVSVNPAATISGEVRLGTGTLVGAASSILQGLRIGPNATIGASACVVHEVPFGTTVKGVPAR